jgi:hypothetical protein
MNCFLIFSCEILKSQKKINFFFELTWVNSCDSRPDSLTKSILKSGLITKNRKALPAFYIGFSVSTIYKGKGNVSYQIALS